MLGLGTVLNLLRKSSEVPGITEVFLYPLLEAYIGVTGHDLFLFGESIRAPCRDAFH